MNIQQLEYIVSVDNFRHFSTAAEKNFVTQPTLSMMIQKLEDELGLKIFDRSKQPVVPTATGSEIIQQAKTVLQEISRLKLIAEELKNEPRGELIIGIIPTLAPYLIPLFLSEFASKYPSITLKISELTTETILDKLENHTLDAGLLATPVKDPYLYVDTLFYEKFIIYACTGDLPVKKEFMKPEEINVDRLWLLEEGHCLRSQIVNLCDLKSKGTKIHGIDYRTGSIDTLMKLVDSNKGITILPELALQNLSGEQLKNICFFADPVPGREISIVTYRKYMKRNLIDKLKSEILSKVPDEMKDPKRLTVTGTEA